MHETITVAEVGQVNDVIRFWREGIIRFRCDPVHVHRALLLAAEIVAADARSRAKLRMEAVLRVACVLPVKGRRVRAWPMEIVETWFKRGRTPNEVRELFYAAIRS